LPAANWALALGFSTTVELDSSMELWRRPELYVAPERLAELVEAYPSPIWTAHLTPVQSLPLVLQFEQLARRCGPNLRAVQINNPLVDLGEIADATSRPIGLKAIFPLGRRIMRMAVSDRLAFHARISQLAASGVIELLLDNSYNRGTPLSVVELAASLEELERWPELIVRIAGRLGDRLEVVERLLWSESVKARLDGWEVEARLRDSDDRFDVTVVETTLLRSLSILQNCS
jgi:hypothetical protein